MLCGNILNHLTIFMQTNSYDPNEYIRNWSQQGANETNFNCQPFVSPAGRPPLCRKIMKDFYAFLKFAFKAFRLPKISRLQQMNITG